MELIKGHSEHKSELRVYIEKVLEKNSDLSEKIPQSLKDLAIELYASSGLIQRTFYDEHVTCHCIFKPHTALFENSSDWSNFEKLQLTGAWHHVMVINKTGEYVHTKMESNKPLANVSPDAQVRDIKSSVPYQSASRGFGFFRVNTPNKAYLDRSEKVLEFNQLDFENMSRSGPWREQAPLLFIPPSDSYNADLENSTSMSSGFSKDRIWNGKSNISSDVFGGNLKFNTETCLNDIQSFLGKNNDEFMQQSRYFYIARFQTILTAYGFPDEVILDLIDKSIECRKNTLGSVFQDISSLKNEVSIAIDFFPKSFGEVEESVKENYNEIMMPDDVKYFILAGSSQEQRMNRLQFVHQAYSIFFGESMSEQISAVIDSVRNVIRMNRPASECKFIGASLKELLATGRGTGNGHRPHDASRIIERIDKGEFPYAQLLNRFDLSGSYSNKEIQQGLRLYHDCRDTFGVSMSNAIALSKIPSSWLTGEFKESVLTAEDMSHSSRTIENPAKPLLAKTLPFLVETGIQIAKAQARGDKSALKNISRDWAWLSKSPHGPLDAITKLDEKYKILASLADYPRLVHQIAESVLLRIASEQRHAYSYDTVFFQEGKIQVDFDRMYECAEYDFNNDSSNTSTYIDEETDEEFEEQIYFSDQYTKFSSFSEDDVWDMLRAGSSNFKSVLEMNAQIHKDYNTFIQRVNEYSNHQISWTPFLEQPTVIDDNYLFSNISDRLALLEEGSLMGHCVFSYLGECVSGNSVILSIRDANNTEERIATLELVRDKPDSDLDEDDDSQELVFKIKQCHGPYNNKVSSEVYSAAESIVEQLNDGTLKYSLSQDNSGEYNDFYSEIERDPLNNGARAHAIPYDTDAVFEAIIAVEKYIAPKTIVDLMGGDESSLSHIFYQSNLNIRGYQPMKNLAQKFGLSVDAVLAVKINSGVKFFDDGRLEKLLPEIKSEIAAISQTLADNIKSIQKPDGKLLTEDGLKVAQSDYSDNVLACKVQTLVDELSMPTFQVDAEQVSAMVQKHLPIERIAGGILAKRLSEQPQFAVETPRYRQRIVG